MQFSGISTNFNVRFRNGGHYDAVLTCPCRFSYFLNKCDKVIVRTSRKSINTIYFLGIRNQLIHQNEAWTAGIEQGL